jgi:GGDEF domain-containing protein
LGWPQVRGAAASALVAGGQSAVAELRAAFAKHSQQREIVMRLAAVCGRIGGEEVVALLKNRIGFADEGVRTHFPQRKLSRSQRLREIITGLDQTSHA